MATSASSDMVSTIPHIDLADLTDRGSVPSQLVDQIGAAARGVGFLTVTNHGVPDPLINRMRAAARRFFQLSATEKQAISIRHSASNRGYVGLSEEALDPKAGADQKEAFNIGLDLPADDPEILAGVPFRGVNLWPADADFKATALAYFDAVWRLGLRLHRPIAVDLGLPPDWFHDKLDRPLATLRLLRYPPMRDGASIPGAGEHTDYGNLTLLMTDDAGGLEVRTRDGEWLPVPNLPGTFIVNIGDCLMRWTNDVYVSTPHRVIHRAPRERLSMAFFLDPNPEADVRVIPTCIDANRPERYPPTTGAAYLRERLDATYAHRRDG